MVDGSAPHTGQAKVGRQQPVPAGTTSTAGRQSGCIIRRSARQATGQHSSVLSHHPVSCWRSWCCAGAQPASVTAIRQAVDAGLLGQHSRAEGHQGNSKAGVVCRTGSSAGWQAWLVAQAGSGSRQHHCRATGGGVQCCRLRCDVPQPTSRSSSGGPRHAASGQFLRLDEPGAPPAELFCEQTDAHAGSALSGRRHPCCPEWPASPLLWWSWGWRGPSQTSQSPRSQLRGSRSAASQVVKKPLDRKRSHRLTDYGISSWLAGLSRCAAGRQAIDGRGPSPCRPPGTKFVSNNTSSAAAGCCACVIELKCAAGQPRSRWCALDIVR